MTFFIAAMIVYQFDMPPGLYLAAILVWLAENSLWLLAFAYNRWLIETRVNLAAHATPSPLASREISK